MAQVDISIDTSYLETELETKIQEAIDEIELPDNDEIRAAVKDQIDMDDLVGESISDARNEISTQLRQTIRDQLDATVREVFPRMVLEMSRLLGKRYEQLTSNPTTKETDQ